MVLNMKFGELHNKTLPSTKTWNKGKWWDELSIEEKADLKSISENDKYACWVVSGEGTPGNVKYRCYICPNEIAHKTWAEHPTMWPKKKEDKKDTKTTYQSWEKKPENKLPFGMRIRCVGCGHWFKQDDIGGHVLNTCPAVHGEDADWAIMCECGGACASLDDVAKLKPGFPRPKKIEATPNDTKPELLDDLETKPEEAPVA